MNPFDLLLPKPDDSQAHVSLKLGTIAPGGVALEGGTVPSSAAISLVDPLSNGDKVLVAMQGRRVYILGVVQGGSTPAISKVLETLALASTQQVNLVFVGDSETAGVTLSTSGYERSWPVVFSHIAGNVIGHEYRVNHNGAWNPDPRWVLHPDHDFDASNGFAARITLNSGEWVEFHGTETTTQVRVHYLNQGFLGGPMGEFTVQVDDGTPAIVTPNNTASIGTWTSSALSEGPHTVTITSTDTDPITILGVGQSIPGPGLLIHNAGVSGTSTADWDDLHHMSMWYSAQEIAAPDVMFLSLGVNDAAAGVAVATYESRYETIMDRALLLTDAVVVVNQPIDSSRPWATWKQYRDAAKALAAERGIPVVDITDRWGTYNDAYARGWMADPTHPTGEGYAEMARAVAQGIGVLPA